MYTELVRRLGGGNTGGGTAANRNRDWRPDTGPMPWLFYGGTDYVDDPNLDLRYGRRGGYPGGGWVEFLVLVEGRVRTVRRTAGKGWGGGAQGAFAALTTWVAPTLGGWWCAYVGAVNTAGTGCSDDSNTGGHSRGRRPPRRL